MEKGIPMRVLWGRTAFTAGSLSRARRAGEPRLPWAVAVPFRWRLPGLSNLLPAGRIGATVAARLTGTHCEPRRARIAERDDGIRGAPLRAGDDHGPTPAQFLPGSQAAARNRGCGEHGRSVKKSGATAAAPISACGGGARYGLRGGAFYRHLRLSSYGLNASAMTTTARSTATSEIRTVLKTWRRGISSRLSIIMRSSCPPGPWGRLFRCGGTWCI